jgi:Tfp pilus assembly protein PilZ
MVSPGDPGRERRRSPRHPVQDVKGTLHLSAEAKILNMSLTGIAVETDTQMKVGRTYSLTLKHGNDYNLRLPGSVVWCHLRGLRRNEAGDTRTVYEAGICFQEALTDQAAELARMLGATAVIALEKRISGRFKVNVAEPVSVRSDYHFVVKTISTVGLLVETEASPPLGTMIEVEVKMNGHTFRSRGRVAHLRELSSDDGSHRSQLGVEFVETSDAERRAIEEFIGRHLHDTPAGPEA